MGNRAPAGGLLALGAGLWVLWAVLAVFYVVCAWKIFVKAGKPGWAAIIPIYNAIVLLEIVGKPVWWFLLWFIPLVNIVVAVLVYIELAKSFGQDVGFAIGLILLSFIFYPILAFGSSRYLGPGGRALAAAPPVQM